MSGTHKIGMIIGEAKPTEFVFATHEDVSRLEYLLIKSTENVAGGELDVEIVAQISTIYSGSKALMEGIKLTDAEKIQEAGLVDNRTFAMAKVLGFLHKGQIYQPRRAIQPGKEVYLAPEDLLEQFYSYPKGEGLTIGNLITRPKVPVRITLKGFRRHLAILAQTGAGKSYTAGVLAEELFDKGATILIIDPHADYVFLGNKKGGGNINRFDVFRTPQSTGRYDESKIGKKIQPYQVKFSDLSQNEIEKVSGIHERFTNISGALRAALDELGDGYSLEDLLDVLDQGDANAKKARNYVERLSYMNVFGTATTDYEKFLKPKYLSVLDLSGLDDSVSDYINYRIMRDIYQTAERGDLDFPVFIFIEEAHRLIPSRENTLSKNIIKRIAAEGRKFGVFLVLITQRPYKIDQDALSQCNSQIIMRMTNPEDQKAIKTSSERVSEELLDDLPGLNVGEAVVVGEITRAPIMVKIRERKTQEGGGDIDIVGKLSEARDAAVTEEKEKPERLKQEVEDLKSMME
ncbi:MAG: putative ATPase [Promethearchaeota archaeon]|nr:MAG: putative ATPase [Candidatus Lokiarchaeota archaeon]